MRMDPFRLARERTCGEKPLTAPAHTAYEAPGRLSRSLLVMIIAYCTAGLNADVTAGAQAVSPRALGRDSIVDAVPGAGHDASAAPQGTWSDKPRATAAPHIPPVRIKRAANPSGRWQYEEAPCITMIGEPVLPERGDGTDRARTALDAQPASP